MRKDKNLLDMSLDIHSNINENLQLLNFHRQA